MMTIICLCGCITDDRTAEGDRFVEGAKNAIAKGMYTTAQTLIVAANEMYQQAGMDEDARDAKILGIHHHLKKSQVEAETKAEEEAVSITQRPRPHSTELGRNRSPG